MTNEHDNQGAREGLVERLAEALIEEGAGPGNSIHGWRCEYPDRYGPCDCVKETADALTAAVLPLVAAQVEAAVSVVRAEARSEMDIVEQDLREVEADARALREMVARVEAELSQARFAMRQALDQRDTAAKSLAASRAEATSLRSAWGARLVKAAEGRGPLMVSMNAENQELRVEVERLRALIRAEGAP